MKVAFLNWGAIKGTRASPNESWYISNSGKGSGSIVSEEVAKRLRNFRICHLLCNHHQKIYYCPLKDNRQVDDSDGSQLYQRVDSLTWSEREKQRGKWIKIKGFPGNHKVKLFRVVLSTKRMDYVVTNDKTQDNTQAVQEVRGFRCEVTAPPSEGRTVSPRNQTIGWIGRLPMSQS